MLAERITSPPRNPQAGDLDHVAAGHHFLASRCGEFVEHKASQHFQRESVRRQYRLSAPARSEAGEQLECAALLVTEHHGSISSGTTQHDVRAECAAAVRRPEALGGWTTKVGRFRLHCGTYLITFELGSIIAWTQLMTTGDDSGPVEASAPLKTLVSKPQSSESSDTNQASASSVPDMSDPDDFLANEAAKRRYLLRRFWRSAIDFWSRKGDRMAWSLSAAVLGLILINLGFQYGTSGIASSSMRLKSTIRAPSSGFRQSFCRLPLPACVAAWRTSTVA